MMDKNEFWELIQTSFREGNWETDKEMEILINKLSEYSQEDIIKFGKIYDIYADESYKEKLWAAAYVMNGGCSDDCFDYFRGWLISQGKEPYFNAMINPDFIIDLDIPYDVNYFENEQMLSVALEAFNKKTGTDDINIYFEKIDEFEIDSDEIQEITNEISFGKDIDATWDDEDEESLKKLVPKLYDQYW